MSSTHILPPGNLPVSVQSTAQAGDQIQVTIGPVEANNGTLVGMIAVGALGPHTYQSTFNAGIAHFTIPAADTQQPGYLALIVASGEARGEASVILVRTQQHATFRTPQDAIFGSVESVAGITTPAQ